ncbi:MAG: translocation protein TolB [Bryobacteraceae bacterium]
MKHYLVILTMLAAGAAPGTPARGQQISGTVEKNAGKAAIAIPDFRGSGEAQNLMNAFNATLFSEVQNSGIFRMVPKTVMPLQIPQQLADFKRPPEPGAPGNGYYLSDWSGPPANSTYLAFGYTAALNGQIVLYGWLFNVQQADPATAQVLGKVYNSTLDDDGAKKVAQQFASDILKQFGGVSLMGTKIYFVSDRSGHKEIWSMDYDGSNQKQFTHYGSISTFPCVAPDGTKLAFTSYVHGPPEIIVHSLVSGKKLPYYNQHASMNAASDFTTDSEHLLIYSTAAAGYSQIFQTNLDGGNLQRMTFANSIAVEPKMNPKTGDTIVFVSDRAGLPQIYTMSVDGVNVARLTNGEGEAVNPSWSPDGQHIAFAWTRGFAPGSYNIFVMDTATRDITQLTHEEGRNENPSWAPDGVHIVYSSRQGRGTEIWTMLANGTGKRQLTTVGNNEKPVWSRGSY